MSERGVISVAVVATDEWLRRGLTHALTEDHRTEAVASLDHDQTLVHGLPGSFDALVVDACGPLDRWDRVAGAAVARRLATSARPPVILSLLPADPFGIIARRMVEAGATRAVGRRSLRSVDDLVRLLGPSTPGGPALPGRSERLASVGVTPRSRLDDGVEFIVGNGLEEHFRGLPPELSRRQLITLRARLNSVMRLDPVSQGSAAVIERTTPSWRQIRAVVDEARGATLGDPALV